MNNDNNNQMNMPNVNHKRGKYIVVNPQTKLLIAKQAKRIGVDATIGRHHRLQLKYGTVSYWATKYARAKAAVGVFCVVCLYQFMTLSIYICGVCVMQEESQQLLSVVLLINQRRHRC